MKAPIVLYEPPKRLRTDYRVGRSAWTDKSMLEEGHFYPYRTMSAEERLWWYSHFFDTVEVNSTFYALSSPDTTALWVKRTQPGFLFNVKAYGLLTGHHVDAARVPDALRRMLPATARTKERGVIPNSTFDDDTRSWAFSELRKGLKPLREAGKLGYVLFQLAPWVKRSDEALAQLSKLPRELRDDDIAIEFRNRSWFGAHTAGDGVLSSTPERVIYCRCARPADGSARRSPRSVEPDHEGHAVFVLEQRRGLRHIAAKLIPGWTTTRGGFSLVEPHRGLWGAGRDGVDGQGRCNIPTSLKVVPFLS